MGFRQLFTRPWADTAQFLCSLPLHSLPSARYRCAAHSVTKRRHGARAESRAESPLGVRARYTPAIILHWVCKIPATPSLAPEDTPGSALLPSSASRIPAPAINRSKHQDTRCGLVLEKASPEQKLRYRVTGNKKKTILYNLGYPCIRVFIYCELIIYFLSRA